MTIEEIDARIEEINNLIDGGTLNNDEMVKLMEERQELNYQKMHARREEDVTMDSDAPTDGGEDIDLDLTSPAPEEDTHLHQHNVFKH